MLRDLRLKGVASNASLPCCSVSRLAPRLICPGERDASALPARQAKTMSLFQPLYRNFVPGSRNVIRTQFLVFARTVFLEWSVADRSEGVAKSVCSGPYPYTPPPDRGGISSSCAKSAAAWKRQPNYPLLCPEYALLTRICVQSRGISVMSR